MKNFLFHSKLQQFCSKIIFNFSTPQFSPQNHSLVRSIYTLSYENDKCGYLILEDSSKSIIAIDPGNKVDFLDIISEIELQKDYKLSHVLYTHSKRSSKHIDSLEKKIEIVRENVKNSTHIAEELVPFSIGELCICYLHTPGHTEDSYSIFITHFSKDSNKIPIMFSGDFIHYCSIGSFEDKNANKIIESFEKVKGFPEETLIFPGSSISLNNLEFAMKIDHDNPFLKMRKDHLSKLLENKINPIPFTFAEEKKMNPFIRCHDPYFKSLTEEIQPEKILLKLKKIENILNSSA